MKDSNPAFPELTFDDILNPWLEFKPNLVANSHLKAIEHQQLYYQLRGEDDDENGELMQEIITSLDNECDHVEKEIVITGNVVVTTVDITKIDVSAGYLSAEAISQNEEMVENVVALSLGYYALWDNSGERKIYHGALTAPQQTLSIQGINHIYQRNYMFIPIDEVNDVRLLEEPNNVEHIEYLQRYATDLIDDLDSAVLNAENIQQALRRLSEVDLSTLDSRARDAVAEHLVAYLDQITELENKTVIPHAVWGFKDIELVHDQNLLEAEMQEDLKIVGTINGFCFTLSGRLALEMVLPFDDNTLRTIKIPLVEGLSIVEQATISI